MNKQGFPTRRALLVISGGPNPFKWHYKMGIWGYNPTYRAECDLIWDTFTAVTRGGTKPLRAQRIAATMSSLKSSLDGNPGHKDEFWWMISRYSAPWNYNNSRQKHHNPTQVLHLWSHTPANSTIWYTKRAICLNTQKKQLPIAHHVQEISCYP